VRQWWIERVQREKFVLEAGRKLAAAERTAQEEVGRRKKK